MPIDINLILLHLVPATLNILVTGLVLYVNGRQSKKIEEVRVSINGAAKRLANTNKTAANQQQDKIEALQKELVQVRAALDKLQKQGV